MIFILKVLLKQYKSPNGPNKFSRGITPTKADQMGPSDTWSVLCRYKFIQKFKSLSYEATQKSSEN